MRRIAFLKCCEKIAECFGNQEEQSDEEEYFTDYGLLVTSDESTSDEDTFDESTSGEDTSDKSTSDEDTSDESTSDKSTSDEDTFYSK